MGKSKVVNTCSRKYYPVRPKIPQQHYHYNGHNNTHSATSDYKKRSATNQPTNQPNAR
jgi:hypothetical protein